jgi:hypothetical protein
MSSASSSATFIAACDLYHLCPMQNHRKDAAKQRRRGGLCLRTMTTFLAALSDGWLAGLFAAWSWSLHKRPTRAERPALHSCTLAAPRRAARLIRRFKLASRSVCQHWMDREPGASREQRSIDGPSTPRRSNQRRQVWLAKDGTPKPFRNEEQVTPGRSARRRSCSCVSLVGLRTALSMCTPLLVRVPVSVRNKNKSTRNGDWGGVEQIALEWFGLVRRRPVFERPAPVLWTCETPWTT